jgi:hypothetical protein
VGWLTYQCWGDDKEDLTNKVEQALAALPSNSGPTVVYGVMGLVGKPLSRGPRKILVICGKSHENVFTVEDLT